MKYGQTESDTLPETGKKKTGGEILTQAVSDYIEAHSREKFSLQKMADDLYVNGCYLLRAFKKHTGYTPLAYHNHVRCEGAKDLLAHTDKGISEIGEIVGFVSSSHFSHVFKKSEGCTPTEYRMNNRTYWEKKENCEEDVS